MKLQKIPQTLTPFAGISYTNEELIRCGLSALTDNYLCIRNIHSYQYSEIVCTRIDIFCCGGEVAEDIREHLRSTLEAIRP